MKVTALIPDQIVDDVKELSGGKNLTDSLVIALEEWISLKKIKELNETISRKPLKFSKDFSAAKVRSTNRES